MYRGDKIVGVCEIKSREFFSRDRGSDFTLKALKKGGYLITADKLDHLRKQSIKNKVYSMSDDPIDPDCDCYICKNYSIGYIRHLYLSKEIAALSLMSLSNLYFYSQLINSIKKSIKNGSYNQLINFVDDRPGHDQRYALNNDKIKALGWIPKTKWSKGLEFTIKWYLKNQDFLTSYSGERLGRS